MLCLVLLVLWQAQATQHTPDLTKANTGIPRTVQSPPQSQRTPLVVKPETPSTPALNENSPFEAGYTLGKEMGEQIEGIGEIKEHVKNLDRAEGEDRKDINDLGKTREHLYFLLAIIGTALTLLGAFIKAFWREMLRPRLRRSLVEPWSETPTPPATHS